MTEALKRRISAAKQRMSAKLLQLHDPSASNLNDDSSAALLASDSSHKSRIIGSDHALRSSGPGEAAPPAGTFTLPTSTSIAHLSALLLLLRNLESSVRKASNELKRIADAERARARDAAAAAEKNDAKHGDCGDCDLPAYGHTFSDSPDELDLPPPPSHGQASRSKAHQSTSDKSKLYLAEEDDDKAWESYIARSSYRFQLWQERISSRTSSSDAEAQLLPPLDVFIVWAALITEQDAQTVAGRSLLQSPHFPLQYVTAYDSASLSIKSSSALREAEHMIDASESVELWQALTSTPFVAPLLEHESLRSTTFDPLTTKGIPLICPSPLCDSHSHTRADQTSQAAAIKHISFLRRRAHAMPTLRASENKRRGLAESGWSRNCPCCQTRICMDTIAGAQLVADLQRWCEDGDFVLSGLAHHVETGMPLPLWHAHAIAASILTPLLSAECLSTSRRSTNLTCLTLASQRLEAQDCDLELDLAFLLPPSGNISSAVASNAAAAASAASLGTSGNSLSAALRAAAAASFSSTPEEIGLTHECSFSRMQSWLVQHGIKAHPSVIQVAERGWDTTCPSSSTGESSLTRNASHHSRRVKRVGMTIGHENSMADKMGGGSSAGGLNFNFDSIAEDANTRMTSQAAKQVSQSIGNVISQRLLKPYRDQCRIGLPPMRPGAGAGAATTTVTSAVEAVKGMSGFSKALESWASAHVLAYSSASQSASAAPSTASRSSEKDDDGGGTACAPPCLTTTTLQKSFVKQALHEYACTMQDLQKRCSSSNDYNNKALGALLGSASKSRLLGRRRAGVEEVLLDREELCELLLEAGPGVRLAWITHMLSTDYTTDIHSRLRSVPLHSWSAISAPTHLSSV
ncbi:hypothetical protein IE81DRAFT_366209 [Ceraceosorus guamensis]|uniref:Uncharacterized protein n=1 Tax=Ceraceosorus guamensis TaxID=1522189 RepID=A0A316W229_9BASI|nr:hypothetical protein IE81DRAFT_366209 [Ceraceosorus guamensis]PWN42823.1 hypothetical protein IE81DRAFT_366209 [Ceraceosorus guamensis]